MSEQEKPLHVRVAEALGWTQIVHRGSLMLSMPERSEEDWAGYPPTQQIIGQKETVPKFATSWHCGGPLIEKYGIELRRPIAGGWIASADDGPDLFGPIHGRTPLIAACNLILALDAAGKLKNAA